MKLALQGAKAGDYIGPGSPPSLSCRRGQLQPWFLPKYYSSLTISLPKGRVLGTMILDYCEWYVTTF